MIILDTNVLSELMKTHPEPAVIRWLARCNSSDLATTVVSLAEINYGIARLPDGRRRDALQRAATELFAAFPQQVRTFGVPEATAYAEVAIARERGGRPIDGFDAQIAAICRTADAALATRNVTDFEGLGLELINPWNDATP